MAGSLSKRSMALWNFKKAQRYGDKSAMQKYLQQYQDFGGTKKSFDTSMNSLVPMGGLSKDNQKRFYDWLSEQDKRYLDKAYKYYKDTMKMLGEM